MKMRWLAAGIAAVLITGGAATVAQRVITQKTRGVLPETNDAAHPDSRPAVVRVEPVAEQVASKPQPAEPPPGLDPAPSSTQLPAATAEVVASPLPVEPNGLALPEPSSPQPVSPTVAVVTADPQPIAPPGDLAPPAATDPAINPATIQGSSESPQAPADPVVAVDSFVERNRKEAEAAIQALSNESETLKDRLTKVEAALSRWQNFARALNTDQPASQPDVPVASKPKWNRTPAKVPARPAEPFPPADLSPKNPAVIPDAPAPEVPANPPVPSPVDLPTPPATAPTAGAKPTVEPPPGFPDPQV